MSKQAIKVLIIENNLQDQEILINLLQKDSEIDYTFFKAESGKVGMDACLIEKPDCIFVDSNLPDINGLEIVKKLNPNPYNPTFPIILLATDSEPLALRILHNGAQDCLIKGEISSREIKHSILKAIELVNLQQKQNRADVELCSSQEQLDAIFKQAAVGICQTDMQGKYVLVNDKFCKIVGRTRQELLKLSFQDITHPEDLEKKLKMLEKMLEGTPPFTIEKRYIRPDKSIVWVRSSVNFIYDADGNPQFGLGTMQDITESKLAEEELRFKIEELKDFVENASVGLHWVDVTGTIIWANQAELKLLGYSADEYIGHSIVNFHADHNTINDILNRLKSGETLLNYEAQLRCKDGSLRYVLINSNVLRKDGKFIHTRCFTRDITERKLAEIALIESNQRYQTLTEISPNTIFVNQNNRIVYVNNSGLKLFGADSPSQVLGKSPFDFFHPDYHQSIRKRFKSINKNLEVPIFEEKIISLDGKIIDVDVAATAFIEKGERAILVTLHDISQRKKTEQNTSFLAEVSQDLAQLSTVNEIMQTVGAKIGDCFNLALCAFIEINELSNEAIVTQNWHRTDVPSLVGKYKINEFVTGEFNRASRAGEVFVVTDTVSDSRTNAGNFAAISIGSFVSIPIVRDGEWRFLLIMSDSKAHDWQSDEIQIMSELTARIWTRIERSYAIEALTESQEVLSLAMRNSRMGAWSRDLITEKVYWSPELEEIFGLKLGTFAGNTNGFYNFVFIEDKEKLFNEIQSALDEHRDYIIEFRFHHKDGSLRWMEGRGQAIYAKDGTPIKLFGIGIDITERKLVEKEREELLEREQILRHEAESANRAKDEFLAVLSHELRTPLNAMFGWTHMLKMNNLNLTQTQKAIEVINRNLQLQNALIEDLLDVSRIISGKMQLESETVSLVSIIQSTLDANRPIAEKQGVQIQSQLDALADEIYGDQHRLQQIINNLLTNAIKFTPTGGTATVELKRVGNKAKLSVVDSGIGIEPGLLPHIFDRFKQADASSKRKYGGLGLGLTIVKNLVELHGGSVEAYSEGLQKGATFTIELPLIETLYSTTH